MRRRQASGAMSRGMTRKRSVIRKIGVGLDLLGEHGLVSFTFRIFPWFLRRRYILFSGDLAGGVPARSPLDTPLRLTAARSEDIPLLIGIRPGFYDDVALRDRFGRGQKCFIGWWRDKPVHIRWAFIGSCELPYLRRTLLLAPGAYYSDEAYTVPAFRDRGIYSGCTDLIRDSLGGLGFRRHLVMFASWDVSLIRTAEKKGLRKIGEAAVWSLLGMKLLRSRGALRDHGDGRISVDQA